MNESTMKQAKVTYYAHAAATPGHFLPGLVKQWRSATFATKDEAEQCLAGYLDGVKPEAIKESGIGTHMSRT